MQKRDAIPSMRMQQKFIGRFILPLHAWSVKALLLQDDTEDKDACGSRPQAANKIHLRSECAHRTDFCDDEHLKERPTLPEQ
jgi:hypothetical protein